jgi:hypothetical protein
MAAAMESAGRDHDDRLANRPEECNPSLLIGAEGDRYDA